MMIIVRKEYASKNKINAAIFMKSGCIFYPFKNSCFSHEKIFWSVPYESIQMTQDVAEMWVKGYSHQDRDNIISPPKLYLSDFNWVSNWIDKHYFYKINEFILFFYL